MPGGSQPLRLWRLSRRKHAATALDGEGARISPGRWNVKGRRAVYLSEHLSLAGLEVLVHTTRSNLPDHIAIQLEVPDGVAIYTPTVSDLPSSWRGQEAPQTTRALGEAWMARGEEALMRVPSVIIPSEMNYLLNPAHPDAERIKKSASEPVPFSFDPRLLQGLR